MTAQVGVFLFNKDSGIELREVCEQALQYRICGIIFRRYAEVDGQFLSGVGLSESGSKAFVKLWFQPFHGSQNRNVRNMMKL